MGCKCSKQKENEDTPGVDWDHSFEETKLSSNRCDAEWETVRGEKAIFGMGSPFRPCARYSVIPGVIRCKVGFSGGKAKQPTFSNPEDHTQAVQVKFDPFAITYNDLLDVFWEQHDYINPPEAPGMESVIFCHNENQKKIAEGQYDSIERQFGQITTIVAPFTTWVDASDEFQHELLQKNKEAMDIIGNRIKPNQMAHSHLAARVEGYLEGFGTLSQFEEEEPELYLPEKLAELIRTHIKSDPTFGGQPNENFSNTTAQIAEDENLNRFPETGFDIYDPTMQLGKVTAPDEPSRQAMKAATRMLSGKVDTRKAPSSVKPGKTATRMPSGKMEARKGSSVQSRKTVARMQSGKMASASARNDPPIQVGSMESRINEPQIDPYSSYSTVEEQYALSHPELQIREAQAMTNVPLYSYLTYPYAYLPTGSINYGGMESPLYSQMSSHVPDSSQQSIMGEQGSPMSSSINYPVPEQYLQSQGQVLGRDEPLSPPQYPQPRLSSSTAKQQSVTIRRQYSPTSPSPSRSVSPQGSSVKPQAGPKSSAPKQMTQAEKINSRPISPTASFPRSQQLQPQRPLPMESLTLGEIRRNSISPGQQQSQSETEKRDSQAMTSAHLLPFSSQPIPATYPSNSQPYVQSPVISLQIPSQQGPTQQTPPQQMNSQQNASPQAPPQMPYQQITSPQILPSQQMPYQQTPPHQMSSPQMASQQIPSQQTPPQQTPFQQISSPQTPPPQQPYQQTPSQQTPPQQMSSPQMASQQTPPQQMPFQQITSPQTPPLQQPYQQMPSQKTPPQQMSSPQLASQQTPPQQMPSQQITSPQTPPSQQLYQQISSQQMPPQQISSPQVASQQAPAWQMQPQQMSSPQMPLQVTPPLQISPPPMPPSQQRPSYDTAARDRLHEEPVSSRLSQDQKPTQRGSLGSDYTGASQDISRNGNIENDQRPSQTTPRDSSQHERKPSQSIQREETNDKRSSQSSYQDPSRNSYDDPRLTGRSLRNSDYDQQPQTSSESTTRRSNYDQIPLAPRSRSQNAIYDANRPQRSSQDQRSQPQPQSQRSSIRDSRDDQEISRSNPRDSSQYEKRSSQPASEDTYQNQDRPRAVSRDSSYDQQQPQRNSRDSEYYEQKQPLRASRDEERYDEERPKRGSRDSDYDYIQKQSPRTSMDYEQQPQRGSVRDSRDSQKPPERTSRDESYDENPPSRSSRDDYYMQQPPQRGSRDSNYEQKVPQSQQSSRDSDYDQRAPQPIRSSRDSDYDQRASQRSSRDSDYDKKEPIRISRDESYVQQPQRGSVRDSRVSEKAPERTSRDVRYKEENPPVRSSRDEQYNQAQEKRSSRDSGYDKKATAERKSTDRDIRYADNLPKVKSSGEAKSYQKTPASRSLFPEDWRDAPYDKTYYPPSPSPAEISSSTKPGMAQRMRSQVKRMPPVAEDWRELEQTPNDSNLEDWRDARYDKAFYPPPPPASNKKQEGSIPFLPMSSHLGMQSSSPRPMIPPQGRSMMNYPPYQTMYPRSRPPNYPPGLQDLQNIPDYRYLQPTDIVQERYLTALDQNVRSQQNTVPDNPFVFALNRAYLQQQSNRFNSPDPYTNNAFVPYLCSRLPDPYQFGLNQGPQEAWPQQQLQRQQSQAVSPSVKIPTVTPTIEECDTKKQFNIKINLVPQAPPANC